LSSGNLIVKSIADCLRQCNEQGSIEKRKDVRTEAGDRTNIEKQALNTWVFSASDCQRTPVFVKQMQGNIHNWQEKAVEYTANKELSNSKLPAF